MPPPNVLWISTHDINPHLGAYAGVYPGAEDAVTPNLDRLAREGMRFDRAFAAAPICGPSRSAIMTGCFPTAIGTMHMRTKAAPPPEVRLVSEYFREAGYYVTNSAFTDFQVPTPPSAFDACGDEAHWRHRPDKSMPFFAAFHGSATHESQLYLDGAAFAARTNRVPHAARHEPRSAVLPPYYPDTPVFRRTWARYHDLITEMDAWVGTLLGQLDQDGLTDNTIVAFWSDHGLGMPRAKRWVNDSGLHEPLIIRWPGHIAPASVNENLTHLMDLAPTMLRMCGLDIPEHMQGRPALTSGGEPEERPNTYVYAGRDRMGELKDRSRTVRDRRYRYIRHDHPDRSPMQHCEYPDHLDTWRELRRLSRAEADQLADGRRPTIFTPLQRSLVCPTKPPEELYDLWDDPYEEHNLADNDDYADVLGELRTALVAWQAAYPDLGLVPEEELLETWRPAGEWRVTAQPELRLAGGRLTATCTTPGACVVWTTDSPEASSTRTSAAPDRDTLGASHGGRSWKILCSATPPPLPGTDVWVKACRLGYLDSAEVRCAEEPQTSRRAGGTPGRESATP